MQVVVMPQPEGNHRQTSRGQHHMDGGVAAGGVTCRDHLIPGFGIVVTVFPRNTVEMWDLPEKDLSGEKERVDIAPCAGGGSVADQRRECTNDRAGQCVEVGYALERCVEEKIREIGSQADARRCHADRAALQNGHTGGEGESGDAIGVLETDTARW